VVGFDDVGAIEVGDGSGKLEDAVEGTGGEVELFHSRPQQALRWRVNTAKLLDLYGRHLGITHKLCAFKAPLLNLSGSFNSSSNPLRAFAQGVIGQLFVFDPWDFDKDVDAVKKRPADSFLIAGYLT